MEENIKDLEKSKTTLIVADTEKITNAITEGLKPLVELWIDKSNETEQLRIKSQTEIENRKIAFNEESAKIAHSQYKMYVGILIGIVITCIVLEIVGRFTNTIGIIGTALIILCVNNIGLPKNKPKE